MKIGPLFALASVLACQPAPSAVPTSASTSRLAADIDTLASPAFSGREAGTAGADSAADFLARRYYRLGLRAAFQIACDSGSRCRPSYFQVFRIPEGVFHNVGAIVDGLDSARRGEYVVIGAHFDHLGHSPNFALDRYAGFVLRPGADDNASGTAAVLELARRFVNRAAKRPILFVNFDAEEKGLIGSRALLSDPPVSRKAMFFMVNLDMVGRLRGGRLFVEGQRIESRVRMIVDSAGKTVGVRPQFVPSEGRTDFATFEREGISAMGLTTGYHADYHTAADVPSHLNITALNRVVDLTEFVVRRIADW
jgi:hypothetical protein